jgi:hypothetical protein
MMVETRVASEKNSAQKSKLKKRTPSSIWVDADMTSFVSADELKNQRADWILFQLSTKDTESWRVARCFF